MVVTIRKPAWMAGLSHFWAFGYLAGYVTCQNGKMRVRDLSTFYLSGSGSVGRCVLRALDPRLLPMTRMSRFPEQALGFTVGQRATRLHLASFDLVACVGRVVPLIGGLRGTFAPWSHTMIDLAKMPPRPISSSDLRARLSVRRFQTILDSVVASLECAPCIAVLSGKIVGSK